MIGNSGHAAVVGSIIHRLKQYKLTAIASEKITAVRTKNSITYLPQDEIYLNQNIFDEVVIAIGDNNVRKKVYSEFNDLNYATIIDPSAVIADDVSIATGTVVMPRVVINPKASIGTQVILNTGCIIEHECVLADFVHISPGAVLAGHVTVGKSSQIGANATVIQGKEIGNDVLVGAGAVVTKNIDRNRIVKGVPAK